MAGTNDANPSGIGEIGAAGGSGGTTVETVTFTPEGRRLPNEAAAKSKDDFEKLATDRQAGKMRKLVNALLLRQQGE